MNDHSTPCSTGVLQGRRIMVVDDSVEERLLLATYLQQEGCRVYLAQDGLDGLRKIALANVDLVLMDVYMPVCDGLDACRILKADPRTSRIPVIFLTGAANPKDRVSGLLAGAVDYVCKPFVFDEVRLRLIIHLRARPASGPAQPDHASQPNSQGCGLSSPLDSILFQSARLKLLQQLDQAPDLAQLSNSLNTYTKRLNEAFRNCVGVTVFEYLREERMKKACELLTASSLKVQEIAPKLGFSSAANFATAFKDRFGLSPRDFRSGLEVKNLIRAEEEQGLIEKPAVWNQSTT